MSLESDRATDEIKVIKDRLVRLSTECDPKFAPELGRVADSLSDLLDEIEEESTDE